MPLKMCVTAFAPARIARWATSAFASVWPSDTTTPCRASQRVISSPRGISGASVIIFTRPPAWRKRSEEHTSELQSQFHLVCRLLLEKNTNDLLYHELITDSTNYLSTQ